MKICSVPGCNKPHWAKGYCQNHYNMWRRNGKPEPRKETHIGCRVNGCEDEHHIKGYCRRHYEQVRSKGEVTIEGDKFRKKNRIKTCSVEGCEKQHYVHGFCEMHNARFERHGTIELPERDYINKEKLCIITGCNEPAYCKEFCKVHYFRDHQRNDYRKLVDAGKCPRCEKPVEDGKSVCGECSDKRKIQTKVKELERLKKGLCVQCGNPATITAEHKNKIRKGRGRLFCEEHYFKYVANRHGGTKNWKMLKEIWNEQKGICVYTGVKLIIGKTATVDHKIPKYENGKDVKENLQWVHEDVNMAKGKLTEKDFIDLCRNVVQHHDQKLVEELPEEDWRQDYKQYEAYP